MGIGSKIKKFRNDIGMTQKDLADELHVTYQAVSRWENDDVEPSIDTLKQMCQIFNCSLDSLFGIENEQNKICEEHKVEENIYIKESQPVLALCEDCNKPIFESNDINRIEEKKNIHEGRSIRTEYKTRILCNACNEERIKEEQKRKEREERSLKELLKKRRIHSYVWSGLCAIVMLIIGLVCLNNNQTEAGIVCMISSIFVFTFIASIILDNNYLIDLWSAIRNWGFIKLPGIIFSFSIDGFIFLIVVKIVFWILGMILAVILFIAATVICAGLSIFVYPYALVKNFHQKSLDSI